VSCRLYLITPPAITDLPAFVRRATEAFEGGDVAALQVRLKPAADEAVIAAVKALTPIAHANSATLILNDRPDLAASLDCDGVHIGQSDWPLSTARAAIGADRIVGVTCHDSRDLAMTAAEEGADYVAFGAFFPTSTKETVHQPDPEILSIWQETMLTPCVAIGGITAANCRPLVTAGADFIAVSAGVWAHPDGPGAAVAAINAEIAAGMKERAAAP
jgi:thiamine-phosphate pyrophosphorylase